uniref:Uncharacterized protein n=1 Tax=Pygocentrus nattereri TaxID=42514 RepID=A0AAR2KE28_PYGNA
KSQTSRSRWTPTWHTPLSRAMSSSTAPQMSKDSPVMRTTRTSDKPPLFSTLMRRRLLTQFMSCTAELSSCLRRTAKANKHSAVPAPRRHSLDRLVVVDRRPTPPRPQDFLGSLNHHSSTCSSRRFCWMRAGSHSRCQGGPTTNIEQPTVICTFTKVWKARHHSN